MSDQFLDRLPSWALIIIAIAAFLNYVLPRFAEASETFAKIFGPLGARWRRRGIRRAEDHRAEVQAEARVLAREIAGEIKPPDYAEMERRLSQMDRRVLALETQDTIKTAFIVEDSEWHFHDQLAESQKQIERAPRLTYPEFERRWHDGWRPTNGTAGH